PSAGRRAERLDALREQKQQELLKSPNAHCVWIVWIGCMWGGLDISGFVASRGVHENRSSHGRNPWRCNWVVGGVQINGGLSSEVVVYRLQTTFCRIHLSAFSLGVFYLPCTLSG